MSDVRARIGYSAVTYVAEWLPKYFYQMAPEGVVMSMLTLQIAIHTPEVFEDLYERGLKAADSFARAGADVIIIGGAPTNMAHGRDNLHRIMSELADKYGVPVSYALVAQGNALKAVGAKKVGSINPGKPRKFGDSIRVSMGEGMELVGRKNVNALLEDYNRISPQTAIELGRELLQEHPEIDTLIYGCPHWPSVHAIEPLEQEFGVNVVTDLQAVLWEGLRLAGIDDRIDGYGKLLREH